MIKQSLRRMCVVLILLMAQIGLAEETEQRLLVVRPEGSWPPWEITVEGSEPTGIHIDLVKEVAKSLNLSVIIKTYPWKRAIQMLKDGDADAITYMSKTDEREQFGYFFEGNVLSSSPIGFFILKKNQNDIHFSGDIKSLQPYTIGSCRGFSYDEAFDKATFLTKDDGASDEKFLLKKLIGERFKIAIGYINDVKYNAKQMGISDQIVFLRPNLSEGHPVYLVFSKAKRHEELAKRFSDGMTAFKSTSKYNDLLKRYGIDEEKAKP